MPYNKTVEEGLKLFDEMSNDLCIAFIPDGEGDENNMYLNEAMGLDEIKSFLTTFAEKIREGVVGEIKVVKENTRNFPMKSNGGNWNDWNEGYDKALDDLLAQLKNPPAIKGITN